jgi:hydrogenase nickel incorporation protein HypB
MSEPRLVEVRRNVLKQNDVIARAARPIPRRGSVRGEPGFESGFRQDDFSREDSHAIAASLSGSGDGTECAAGLGSGFAGFLVYRERGEPGLSVFLRSGRESSASVESVTEGEDKPLKYPTIFNSGDIAVVTKNELADSVEFDWEAARTSIHSVRPGMQIFRLSAKTGEGMEEYLNFLSQQLVEHRVVAHI